VQKKKNSRSGVTEAMCAELHTLILNHLHVVDSLIARDMLLIKDPDKAGIKNPDIFFLKYQYDNCRMICSFWLMVGLLVFVA
jgi:hypothetical protein